MINFEAVYRKLYTHLDGYSGSKFIRIIRENDPDFPEFNAYIESRREQKKSTLRKDYFKDILFSYPEDFKLKMLELLLDKVETEDKKDVSMVRTMLEG
jgi:hypothetical protein